MNVVQFWRALAPWQRRELLAGIWLVPTFMALFAATWVITP